MKLLFWGTFLLIFGQAQAQDMCSLQNRPTKKAQRSAGEICAKTANNIQSDKFFENKEGLPQYLLSTMKCMKGLAVGSGAEFFYNLMTDEKKKQQILLTLFVYTPEKIDAYIESTKPKALESLKKLPSKVYDGSKKFFAWYLNLEKKDKSPTAEEQRQKMLVYAEIYDKLYKQFISELKTWIANEYKEFLCLPPEKQSEVLCRAIAEVFFSVVSADTIMAEGMNLSVKLEAAFGRYVTTVGFRRYRDRLGQ